jgi:phage tail protein X
MQTAALLQEDLNDNITRNSICSDENAILTKVYDTNVNLAIWQRQLSQGVAENVADLLKTSKHLDTSSFIREQCINSDIKDAIKSTALANWSICFALSLN